MLKRNILWVLLFFVVQAHAQTPPDCQPKSQVYEMHGHKRLDSYAWLKDRKSKQVKAYLEAENAYTQAVMTEHTDLQTQLVKEMKARINEEDISVPYQKGSYWYYKKYKPDAEYPVYYRAKDRKGTAEEVILDVASYVEENKIYNVYGYVVSPDERYAAFSIDKDGSFSIEVRIKDLTTGRFLDDRLEQTAGLVWSQNSKQILYGKKDAKTNRAYRIYLHELGKNGPDALVYEDTDPLYDVFLYKSTSRNEIFINSMSADEAEVHLLPADDVTATPKVVKKRTKGHMYYMDEFDEGHLLVQSNKDRIDFALYKMAKNNVDDWQLFYTPAQGITIEMFSVFQNHVAVTENHKGSYRIRVMDKAGKLLHYIDGPEKLSDIWVSSTTQYADDSLRLRYESYNTPSSIYNASLANGQLRLLDRKKVPTFTAEDYKVEQIYAPTQDGKEVPVSLLYRKGMELNGQNPVFLRAYGAYGYSMYPTFNRNIFSLVDRGFIVAVAHVRGGMDLGYAWYTDGKMLNKKNTFLDYEAAAKALIDQGYTSKGLIAGQGVSAGGLLAGYAINTYPDYFSCFILDVPFVDALNTMLDPDLPLTTQEYLEWGNPNKKEDYHYIFSYAPYENVRVQDYPHLLFITGIADEQVGFWEPAKMVARLRDRKTDDNRLLLYTEMQGGHTGKSGRYAYLEEVAMKYAFILTSLDDR